MKPNRQRGLVAVLVLGLLGFVGLLVVSLATLARLETRAGERHASFETARLNALLGLEEGLARLQALAGGDARVTATAGLAEKSVAGTRHWTGAWDSRLDSPEQGRLLGWLVSGEDPDPAQVPSDGIRIDLVAGEAGRQVSVAKEPIWISTADGAAQEGYYAFWVGDEGVKARIDLGTQAESLRPETALRAAQRFGIEQILSAEVFLRAREPGPEGEAARDQLRNWLVLEQLPLAAEIALSELRRRFHDITLGSRGVLTDPRRGGLKLDLSLGLQPSSVVPSGPVFPGGPDWSLLRSFAGLRASGPEPAAAAVQAHSPFQHGLFPIPLLVQVAWGCRSSPENPEIGQTAILPLVSVANPYDVSLPPTDYVLTWHMGSGQGELLLNGAEKGLPGSALALHLDAAAFGPGEVNVFAPSPSSAFNSGVRLSERQGADEWVIAPGEFDLSTGGASELQWVIAPTAGHFVWSLADGTLLQEIRGPDFGGASGDATLSGSFVPLASLRARMRTSRPFPGTDEGGFCWLAAHNPRALLTGGPLWKFECLLGQPTVPSAGSRGFWGPTLGPTGESIVPLFHVPRAPLVSLAELAQANLARVTGPAFPFGNSHAGPYRATREPDFSHRLNLAAWDRFFFSSLEGEAAEPSHGRFARLSPGPRLEKAALQDPRRSAAYLAQEGAFNVNSTSLEAWRAFLASLAGVMAAGYDPVAQTEIVWDSGGDTPVSRKPVASGGPADLWRGFRVLSAGQVEGLAAQVVARIRQRGCPFLSLAEFVNRPLSDGGAPGLLQEALDAVSAVAVDGRSYESPRLNQAFLEDGWGTADPAMPNPEGALGPASAGAPGYLLQADLLRALAPALAVRSDTFRIRAYGEAPAGSGPARAWCEALVQRSPEFSDPSQQAWTATEELNPANRRWGRRFRIVQFRWLAQSEL